MPTGQAVAQRLGFTPPGSDQTVASASSPQQAEILLEAKFISQTSLWFYVLAEANHFGGEHLGPVGSTIIAEVLIGLVRRSEDSIQANASFSPTLGSIVGEFTLPDLLRLASVL